MTHLVETRVPRIKDDNTSSSLIDVFKVLALKKYLIEEIKKSGSFSQFIDRPKWKPIKNEETTRLQMPSYVKSKKEFLIDEIESPLMAPKKRYKVNIKIKNVRRGLPSTGDDTFR